MKKNLMFVCIALLVAMSLIVSCDNSSKTPSESQTVPTKEFTVTFDPNFEGGAEPNSVKVEDGKTVAEPTKPKRDGYSFVEWQLDGQKYDFKTPVKKDITLKALWVWNGTPVTTEQELINALSSESTTIFIKENFTISDAIEILKPVTINGNGKKITVMYPQGDKGTSGLLIKSSGVIVRNLVLESGESAKNQMSLVYLYGANGTDTKPIIIENCILNCNPNNSFTNSVIGIQTTYDSGNNLIIKNNTITNAKYGMYFNGISNSIIDNNIIKSTKYNGIIIAGDNSLYQSRNVEITNNNLSDIATENFENKVYATGIYVGKEASSITVDNTNNVSMANNINPKIYVYYVDGEFVATEEQLKSAIETGKNIFLVNDIETTTSNGNINYWCGGDENNKSYRTSNYIFLIEKDLKINGNGHTIADKRAKSGYDSLFVIKGNNLNIELKNLGSKTNSMSTIIVADDSKNINLNIDNCELKASSYVIKSCNGTNNMNLQIKNNSNLYGWAALNLRSSNSLINIIDSNLAGYNSASESPWNNYASLVLDGDSLFSKTTNTYGSNNTVNIKNSIISAETGNSNTQSWLSIQYGAANNTVTVDENCTISPNSAWTYCIEEGGTDVHETNTVTIKGIIIPGINEE